MNEVDMAARLAVLEVKVEQWNKQCAEDRASTKADIKSLDGKIDELLTFRSKGMGAFWFASTLFGSSLFGAVAYFTTWLRH